MVWLTRYRVLDERVGAGPRTPPTSHERRGRLASTMVKERPWSRPLRQPRPPHLAARGRVKQLVVGGEPFLLLGGELGKIRRQVATESFQHEPRAWSCGVAAWDRYSGQPQDLGLSPCVSKTLRERGPGRSGKKPTVRGDR